jgi:hypothetical protein
MNKNENMKVNLLSKRDAFTQSYQFNNRLKRCHSAKGIYDELRHPK